MDAITSVAAVLLGSSSLSSSFYSAADAAVTADAATTIAAVAADYTKQTGAYFGTHFLILAKYFSKRSKKVKKVLDFL